LGIADTMKQFSLLLRSTPFLALLAVNGCSSDGSSSGRTCTLMACNEGLVVNFDHDFPFGTTYEVSIAQVTGDEPPPVFATCEFVKEASGESVSLRCSSALQHQEFGESAVLRDTSLERLLVTISVDGSVVDTQQFEVSYTTREINGPGCGYCTSASILVSAPPDWT